MVAYWLVLGFLAGALAKFLLPGRDPAGCIFTILLGIIGAVVGGYVGTYFGWGHVTAGSVDLRSILIATVGAMIVLVLGRLARRL